jgi:hypothetical protein
MSATCGCCKGVHLATPRPAGNRHGLSSIVYRAGVHASFKRSMIAALGSTKYDLTGQYPLSRLTRDDDDFSIALLDAWAVAADVLTFYQERIANESYLRTAGERLSVVELTRLIGYELAPGVAASVWLSFEVDDAEGAPGEVTIAAGTKVQSIPPQDEMPQAFETSAALDARAEWNTLVPRQTDVRRPAAGHTDILFAGTGTNLSVGDALLFYRTDTAWNLRRVATVDPDFEKETTYVTWAPALTATAFPAGNTDLVKVYAMRVKAPLFGHNAIDTRTLSAQAKIDFGAKISGTDWTFGIAGASIDVEGEHPEIAAQSKAILESDGVNPALFNVAGVNEVTRTEYALSGRATQLTLNATPSGFSGTKYRATIVYAANEELELAEYPRSGNLTQPVELDRSIATLDEGRAVIVSSAGGKDVELAIIDRVDQLDAAHTKVTFTAALAKSYDVKTVKISANVIGATHGETVRETLGSGDTATPFLRFKLSQGPLTYVPSSNGAAATLAVYVNDILWAEAPTLYGTSTRDRVYETLRDEEERTFVQFGDGRTEGAPVPTGKDNIRAVYRKGIGDEGNVGAGTLKTLMSQPLGLDGVINPLAAEGGADPEALADARENAPGTTRTLERVVSLSDYQAFAASFAGVKKAVATWTLAGTDWQVFLTIAGPNGATFTNSSATVEALRGALLKSGDPFVPLRIASFVPVGFVVVAKVGVDADRVAEIVLQGVRDTLAEAFSFDARSFGEAVDLSDLIAAMHGVAGVRSIDIDLLYRVEPTGTTTPARNERLAAATAQQLPNGTLRPAEILILSSAQITEATS